MPTVVLKLLTRYRTDRRTKQWLYASPFGKHKNATTAARTYFLKSLYAVLIVYFY